MLKKILVTTAALAAVVVSTPAQAKDHLVDYTGRCFGDYAGVVTVVYRGHVRAELWRTIPNPLNVSKDLFYSDGHGGYTITTFTGDYRVKSPAWVAGEAYILGETADVRRVNARCV